MTRQPASASCASSTRNSGGAASSGSATWSGSRTSRGALRCAGCPGPLTSGAPHASRHHRYRGGQLSQPAPIAVALDAPDLETAARWAGLVTPHVSTVKIGLELYLRYGPGGGPAAAGHRHSARLSGP